jgi:hypothetical protein
MTDASLTPSPPRPAGIYAAPDALDKQPLRAADVTPSQCEQACKDPANEALPRCAVGLTNVTLNIEGDSRREKK